MKMSVDEIRSFFFSSFISIVFSVIVSLISSLIVYALCNRKLNKLQQKDLIFKYSPYPYIEGLYINPHTDNFSNNSALQCCQKLSETDLDSRDRDWIKEHGKAFAYRVFSGKDCFVWKLDDSSDSGYKVSHCINTLVLKNIGERMISAEIKELRMFGSLESQEYFRYEGSGVIHRILQAEGNSDILEIPLTVISYNDNGGCAEEEPYIGTNLLDNPCVRNLFTWVKLEIDISAQNITGESYEYILRLIYSDRQVYAETVPKQLIS